jgi:hypothetical protein
VAVARFRVLDVVPFNEEDVSRSSDCYRSKLRSGYSAALLTAVQRTHTLSPERPSYPQLRTWSLTAAQVSAGTSSGERTLAQATIREDLDLAPIFCGSA